MKTFSAIYLIVSVFVLPCILNLEMLGCCFFIMVNVMIAFALFCKHNPECILKDNNK